MAESKHTCDSRPALSRYPNTLPLTHLPHAPPINGVQPESFSGFTWETKCARILVSGCAGYGDIGNVRVFRLDLSSNRSDSGRAAATPVTGERAGANPSVGERTRVPERYVSFPLEASYKEERRIWGRMLPRRSRSRSMAYVTSSKVCAHVNSNVREPSFRFQHNASVNDDGERVRIFTGSSAATANAEDSVILLGPRPFAVVR